MVADAIDEEIDSADPVEGDSADESMSARE